jgi:hypothetical protein
MFCELRRGFDSFETNPTCWAAGYDRTEWSDPEEPLEGLCGFEGANFAELEYPAISFQRALRSDLRISML